MPGSESKKRVPPSRKQIRHTRYPSGITSVVSITVHARISRSIRWEPANISNI
jgi:hypothetical protein